MATFRLRAVAAAVCCTSAFALQTDARVLSETVVGDVTPSSYPIVSEQRQQPVSEERNASNPEILEEEGVESENKGSLFSGIVRFFRQNSSKQQATQKPADESKSESVLKDPLGPAENQVFAAGERAEIRAEIENPDSKLQAPSIETSLPTVNAPADILNAQVSMKLTETPKPEMQEPDDVDPLVTQDGLGDKKQSSVFSDIKNFVSRLTRAQSESARTGSANSAGKRDEIGPEISGLEPDEAADKIQAEDQLDAVIPIILRDTTESTATERPDFGELGRIRSSSVFVPRIEDKEVSRAGEINEKESAPEDTMLAEIPSNAPRLQRNYSLRESFELPLVEGDQKMASTDPSLNEIEVIGQEMSLMLQEVMDGEDDPTKRLAIEPVIERAINAVETSPLFLQAQQNIETYRAIRDQVLSQKQPQLDGQIGYGQRSSESISSVTNEVVESSGGYQSRSLSSSLVLFDFGSIDYQAKAAESRGEATKAQVRALKAEVFLDAVSAFYEVQRALLQLRLARENVNSRQAFVRYVRDRTELGASSAADVIRAESRVAEAMDLLSSAAQSLARSQAGYREFYGEEAEPYILPQEIEFDAGAFRDLESLVMMHPEMEKATLDILAAENDYKAALAGQNGALSLQLQASQSQSPGDSRFLNDQTMSLGFSGSLYDGGGSRAQSEQAAIALNEAKLARDILGRRILRDLRDAYAEYEGQIAAVSARRMVMTGAEDAYAISKEMYSFSRISLFELLKTQEEVFSAGQRLIDSVVERALSKYRLLYVSNKLAEVFNDRPK